MTDRIISIGAIARRHGVSQQTVRNWIRSGHLPAERTASGRYRVRADDTHGLLVDVPIETKAICGVYFVRCGAFMKVGYAANIRERVTTLACATPYPISLAALIRMNDPKLALQEERALHRQFSDFKFRNEWFHSGPIDEFLQSGDPKIERIESVVATARPELSHTGW